MKIFKKIETNSEFIKSIWLNLSKKYNVPINVMGTIGIPSFVFCKDHDRRKTFLTQEMLKNKILASNMIYITIFHTKENIKKYTKILEKVFYDISNKKIKYILKTKVCFRPMNRIN